MFLEAIRYWKLASLGQSNMFPLSEDSEFHHTLPQSIHQNIHLIVPTYTLEYVFVLSLGPVTVPR